MRDLEGHRFLERETPITPLGECSCPKCRCRYIHYDDRRSGEDRRDPLISGGRLVELQGSGDRRCNRDRRKVDSTMNRTEQGYKEILAAAVEE